MKYFLGFLAAIGLIVVVFILILRGFDRQSGPESTIDLLDYASTETAVQLMVDGPVRSDQEHQMYRITVGRAETVFEMVQGYENRVVERKVYPSNQASYEVFLSSLQKLGFTKGNDDPERRDERGFCPAGTRYIFEIVSQGTSVQRFWATSCGGGTFRGDNPKIRTLFLRQVPDYPKLLKTFRSL